MAVQFFTASLVGTVGRDAELRFTPNGQANLKFSVASDKKERDKEARTRWVNVTVWGKQAEALEQYVKKGQIVAVSGDLDVREYQDKNGATRTSIDLNANTLQLVGGKRDDANGGNTSPKASSDDLFADTTENFDDVPF